MKKIKTELEALEKAEHMWLWLVDNYPKTKDDYFEIFGWSMYVNDCPLCEYIIDDNGYNCQQCCLKNCNTNNSLFQKWDHATKKDISKGQEYAQEILNKICDRITQIKTPENEVIK